MYIMKNKMAKKCNCCKTPVAYQAGFAAKPATSGWITSCASTRCLSALGLQEPMKAKQVNDKVKVIKKGNSFIVEFGYSPENVALIKGMPSARWNPEAKSWEVPSSDPTFYGQIADVALRMGASKRDLPDVLQEVITNPEAFLPKNVAALCNNAKAVGAYPFQVEGVAFLAAHKRVILGDDMGLGKTVQVLLALPSDRGTLVFAPKAVLSVWLTECRKWRKDITVSIVSGKEVPVPKPGELVITNYDSAAYKAITPESAKAFSNVTLVADEAHYLKGKPYKEVEDKFTGKVKKTGVRRVATFRLVSAVAEQIWLVTGTPLANKVEDLWGILTAGRMEKDVFGSWMTFVKCFRGYKGRFGYTWGEPTQDVPERLRRVMIRRTKAEVLPDLPKKVYTDINIALSKKMSKDLDQFRNEWGEYMEDTNSLPGFEEFAKIRVALAKDRIPAMLETIQLYEEQDTPLVVFSAHRAPIDALKEREGWAVITGDTKTEERGRVVEEFQKGRLKGVALTIAAGGVGLTLTKASHILFVDLAWRPCDNAQAEDRICRIGQTAMSCNVLRMVSDHPLDLHVHKLLIEKQHLISGAVENLIEKVKEDKDVEETEEEWLARIAKFNEADEAAQRKIDAEKYDEAIDRIMTSQRRRGNGEEQKLTPMRKIALCSAYDYMKSICDGAIEKDGMGFSKPDAGTARIIAINIEDDRSMRALERLLSRYKGQLEDTFPILYSDNY